MHVLVVLYLVTLLARGSVRELGALSVTTVVLLTGAYMSHSFICVTYLFLPHGVICLNQLSFLESIWARLTGRHALDHAFALNDALTVALRLLCTELIDAVAILLIKTEDSRIDRIRAWLRAALPSIAVDLSHVA